MLKKIFAGVVALILALAVAAALRPSEFTVTRSLIMNAAAPQVFAQVNDFHNWQAWSPWAKMDPNAKISYEGAPAGTGAVFRWDGDKKVGAGSMTILESRPSNLINIELDFTRPFKSSDTAVFTFESEDDHTLVTWAMSGKRNLVAKAIGLFVDCDKVVGGQFEQGLVNLKALSEAPPPAGAGKAGERLPKTSP